MWGRPINWSTARIWALVAGGADEPGVIWCGTLPGGLFRSTDHGQSWQILRALWDHPKRKQWMGGGADLPGIHSICVDPRDSRRVWIAVSTGGIWFTENTGESWTLRGKGMRAEYAPPEQTHDPIAQDVHCLVQCRAAPERMWVQHHNGIFASSDESQTFIEITGVEPSTFGFAVAVHPRDPVAGAGAMPPIPANTRRSWSRSRPTSSWSRAPRRSRRYYRRRARCRSCLPASPIRSVPASSRACRGRAATPPALFSSSTA